MCTGKMPTTKHWTTESNGEVNIKVTLSGPAALPPVTLMQIFIKTVSKCGDCSALRVKRHGHWWTWNYKEYYKDVTKIAKSLIKTGLEFHHGVGLIGYNAPEWSIAYTASIMAGGIAVGVYTTNNKEACHYIAENSTAQVFFCEDHNQLLKLLQVKDRLPNVKAIVKYLPESVEPLSSDMRDAGIITWEEFLDIGKDVPDYEVTWRMNKQKPGHCASIIYTSGTTGPPKGVMLSHDNIVWSGTILAHSYSATENERHISYLPLSHIAGQLVDIVVPAIIGSCVWFAQPDALKGSLKETILEAHPTFFFAVPRVWEKFKESIELEINTATGLKALMIEASKSVGRKAHANRLSGQSLPWGYWLAKNTVFKSLREKMGLDRCRLTTSSAAPLPMAVTEFFSEFDIPIYQTYGMSETSGVSCFNCEGNYKPGSAGCPMMGMEMKIDNPDTNGDGEICFRGRHVFMGYLHQMAKTTEVLDDDGWLHSGDIGRVDSNGFYFITGRLKELIITSGGENIAPVPIEQNMKEQIGIISNVMVVGDDRRYLTMLVTLRCLMINVHNPTDELNETAKRIAYLIGSRAKTVTQARGDTAINEYIKQGMERANELAISRAARVQKFSILPVEFSINGGELTPTLKLKRKVVHEKYKDIISSMYS